MELPAKDAADLIEHAFNEALEEKLYARWISGPQFVKSYEDFKRELMPPKFKSDEELMADIEKIMDGGIRDGNI